MPFQARPISFKPPRLKGLSASLHRQPLREQLRRRRPPAERDPRRARRRRSGRPPALPPERPEARGADRHQLDAAARGLLRSAGRRRRRRSRPARSPRRSRATSARSPSGAPSSSPWARRWAAARAGCCSRARRATARSATSGRPTTRIAWPAARRAGARHVRALLSPRFRRQCRRPMSTPSWPTSPGNASPAASPAARRPARPHTVDTLDRAPACSRPIPNLFVIDARLADDAASVPVRLPRRAARTARQGRRRRGFAAQGRQGCSSIAPGASRSAAIARPSCASAASMPSRLPAASAPGGPTACRPNLSRKESRHEVGHPRTSEDRSHCLPLADPALHREGSRSSSTCRPTACWRRPRKPARSPTTSPA